ncbi:MAG: DUF374 domain-containing protein [Candidatus Kapaibacterium sp.]
MLNTLLSSGLTTLIRSLGLKWIGEPLPDKCVIAFWHSQMLAGWWVSRKDAVALVSKSKDGQYLANLLTKWSYNTVRGSSSVSGKEALDEALEMILAGRAKRLVITPDGPRGPREIFKRGAFIAAKELSLPLYFLSIKYRNAWHLPKSWDKFQIPLPFSGVIITPHLLDANNFPFDPESQKEFLEKISGSYRSSLLAEKEGIAA